MTAFPKTQFAVQLVGPSKLELNTKKTVGQPGPHEILIKMEAVGLCFSDLKLLKQFSAHPRKSEIQAAPAGLDLAAIRAAQGYMPGEKPVVPGHEVVARIVAVGGNVKQHQVGERVLVQADWRELRTAGSNGAFGYNFEGGLQEYSVVDERVVIDSKGQRYLMPVGEDKSRSSVALVEPWACVEASYVNSERRTLKAGGKAVIVVADRDVNRPLEWGVDTLDLPYAAEGKPAEIRVITPDQVAALPNEGCDDIIYFGHDKAVLDVLNDKLATRGIINVVLAGQKIGAKVNVGVGRVHYGMTRWIGTTGSNAADSYRTIPASGEIRAHEKINIIGAGGPMGQMHVIRDLCAGVAEVTLVATDMDDARLASLEKKVGGLARANQVNLRLVNTAKTKLDEKFSYYALMAPVAALVGEAIAHSGEGTIINIFAGIPAPTKFELDLDTYIAHRCFMFGTSGSEISDMAIVLKKVEAGTLDTNASVDAVSGMAGAIAGIAATENRTLAGKIIVYPMLHDMGLVPLTELAAQFPTVAAKLEDGRWTKAAEAELLRVAK